ncbi:DUF397 domain-containing protein [Amycolatopsis sp. FDAARGOS 1241]|uniref:DUF397 domain-containing protein n=1 Tax=Amycolatopsis sp. FDAARGOS 1241 TaxID=2778070 RepID=UPI00194F8454|nr:DUF397 domain-containing protein [Amycolatopsis sp. FDAARGOS 1241]QRP45791.1 DUF397 domain-containing protein [Amycolatopsis sp. FDAARGOS 1241]
MNSRDQVWRKSSYSGGNSGNVDCVEVALGTEVVGVRDTKAREAGELHVPAEAWLAFVRGSLQD